MTAPASRSPDSPFRRRGVMLVLVGPPASGKTTISRAIMAEDPATTVSISATTRAIRAGEVDGQHYHFVTPEKFKSMVDAGDMLEHALVYNNFYYGTPRQPVEAALAAGRDVFFDIDWQGARQLKASAPEDVATIFLLPPSWGALEGRLRGRAADAPDEIERRLKKAGDEISHYAESEYIVVNDDLKDSIAQVKAILVAERLKRRRLPDIDAFVQTLRP